MSTVEYIKGVRRGGRRLGCGEQVGHGDTKRLAVSDVHLGFTSDVECNCNDWGEVSEVADGQKQQGLNWRTFAEADDVVKVGRLRSSQSMSSGVVPEVVPVLPDEK